MNNLNQQTENKYKRVLRISVKTFGVFLAFLLLVPFFTGPDLSVLVTGLIILVFYSLPTIFIVFFKNKVLARYPGFAKPWKVIKIVYIFVIVLFLGIAVSSLFWALNVNKTQKTIEFINSQKITLEDVMGKNLPPMPDKTLNDSTIEGIDANNNYIRDDVELAIFEKYPNSAKIRAAALQYAQVIQLKLTKVFNSETLVATIQKDGNAYMCFGISMPKIDSNLVDKETDYIKKFILDTDIRRQKFEDIYEYMTTYSLPDVEFCDVDKSLLPN